MNEMPTARNQNLRSCPSCALVSRPALNDPEFDPDAKANSECPRCGTVLHLRKHESLTRTTAFLMVAYFLYIPANILPMMLTNTLATHRSDTIFSGIIYLWTDGSWILACIVFVASITVPLIKLLTLSLLVWSVRRGSTVRPMRRTKAYRFVEFIGRWSMLDIYVVALLGALVQSQALATISVGPAAIPFGGVVIFTMLATLSFDPRLIWDVVAAHDEDEPLESNSVVSPLHPPAQPAMTNAQLQS